MIYTIYILRSVKDGKFYTGITNNIQRRLHEHNTGKNSTPSTKFRGPFVLVYKEEKVNRDEARKREKFLKSGAGREFRNKILASQAPR